MPKVTAEHLAARRSQIVRAALRSFARDGFIATTMADIAEEADLSVGVLYRYFPSKDALLEAVMEASRKSDRASRASSMGDGSPLERLEQFFLRHLEWFGDPGTKKQLGVNVRAFGEALMVEGGPEIVQASLEEAIEDVEAVVREGQESGLFRPELDPRATATAIMIQIIGMDFVALFDPSLDTERLAEPLLLFARSLCR